MEQIKSYTSIVLAVAIGILLQFILVWADEKDSPAKAAEHFAQAYYRLDPAMGKYLCEEILAADDENVIERYILRMEAEADERGVRRHTMKSALYDIETFTRFIDDENAEVRITAGRKTSINPVYARVAKLFFIGETYPVDEVLQAVKEDGRWKICGNPFALTL